MSKLITRSGSNFTESFRPSSRTSKTPVSVTRDILKVIDSPNVISFAGGLPDDSLFPVQELTEIFQRSALQKGPKLFQYADTQGHPDLRAWIAERYYHGSSPEEIIITSASQQALDLVSRYFIEEGSNIILERPSYLGAIQVFSSYSPNFLGVDYDPEEGPNTEQLEHILRTSAQKPKFFYCIPDFQNPSGGSYSSKVREKLSEISSSYGLPLLEDTAYRELSFNGNIPISLYDLDPERTVSIGTFSKTLSPGLRVGWIRAPKPMIQDLIVQKQSMDLHSPTIGQELVFQFVSSSKYEAHLSKIRDVYKRKALHTSKCLQDTFGSSIPFRVPNGGLFFWLEFPKSIDTDVLFRKSLQAGLATVPGSAFYIGEPVRNHLRWNFSNASEEETEKGIKRLFDIYSSL
ncbi:PLP-dependent aminotransferase family protein [Leptospira langatensis]|uniref:PLP-dependent aminotransferase family protein n=1 Tax=Leptospira langatensis TaxID=2484983 RepID=A0A5F1ZV73_9LEPT|nr:PLP-dependent aminotransferase family protein [Leptospira langatensis]TGK01383.1 PLP-dependent aminotransferase family protein [Leptospira langatensis]TGL42166.1 PLP-dependent aminotransferase family protein [Leptospira langatensis]